MNLTEAVCARRSIRVFEDRPLEDSMRKEFIIFLEQANAESGLNMQLILNEPNAFGKSLLAKFGRFRNCSNYIAIVGKKSPSLEEKAGYYGEAAVLHAQKFGLGTCWTALTYKKTPEVIKIGPDEKLVALIALGYPAEKGHVHKRKKREAVVDLEASGLDSVREAPLWFRRGVDLALLAPTAMNQQRFQLTLLHGDRVRARAGRGFCTKIDLGIIKYHFEIGASPKEFRWM